MQPGIRAILFDLNETILHQIRSDASHMAFTYAALAPLHWSLTFEAFACAWKEVQKEYATNCEQGLCYLRAGDLETSRAFLHEPWYRENIRQILQKLELPLNEWLVEQLTWTFQQSWVEGLTLPVGNDVTLRHLIANGYPLGLVTNFQQPDILEDILNRFNLGNIFQCIVVSASVGMRKPHPDLFHQALQQLRLSPGEDILYVGDNLIDDVEGARLAGLRPVLLDVQNQFPEGLPAVTRLTNLAELPDYVETLTG
jgi:FMN phosphatase YigB (HAD superfamily)